MESGIREGLESIVGPPHVPTGAGSHDGSVDERIRRIKDNMRALQAGLPYELGDALTIWCTYYACYVLNLLPARSGDGLSPREVFTGLKPDYKRVVPVAFGTFCQVKEKKTNTLATRSVTAIALLQTGHGPFKFTSLYTGRVITRLQFRPMQSSPHEHILILNSMQERRRIGTEDLLSPDTDVEETTSTLNIVNLALGDAIQQNMNIKEAFRVFGEVKTRESVKKELQNMLDKDVKLFLKIKDDGSLKSRLVAGGHRQSKDVYERKSSPTVGTSAILYWQ